jgi:hypothetical protein
MNSPLHRHAPTNNSTCVDFVIPTKRGHEWIIRILRHATKNNNPAWRRHRLCIVFDADLPDGVEALDRWVFENRDVSPLPEVVCALCRPEARGNRSALRQQGLEMGDHPFVYFQDDDDPLPGGVEPRIRLMQEQDWDAVMGVTETLTERGQLIERFPSLDAVGNYLFDPVDGARWFPTYIHPLSGLFRRTALEKSPYDDKHSYLVSDNGAFFLRFLFSGAKVFALPDVMRRAVQHADNDSEPIMQAWQRVDLAKDIRFWQTYVTDPDVKDFQLEVANMLEAGTITTFKEITSLVENQLEEARARRFR